MTEGWGGGEDVINTTMTDVIIAPIRIDVSFEDFIIAMTDVIIDMTGTG